MNPYLITPNIIKETANGTTYCPIQDELFTAQRSVEVVGEITKDSVYSLILQLRYLHHSAPGKEITMYINSPGGSVCDGLALYDVMAAVKCPIRTVCVGMAASMGALQTPGRLKSSHEPAVHPPCLSLRAGASCAIRRRTFLQKTPKRS